MKVEELIEELCRCDKDAEVFIYVDDDRREVCSVDNTLGGEYIDINVKDWGSDEL